MSNQNSAHGGSGPAHDAVARSAQAGIADEGAAYTAAIDRDAGTIDSSAAAQSPRDAQTPVIGAGTAGAPGVAEREGSPRIDLTEEDAAQRWADRHSVTRAQLEKAVSAVGEDAHAVQTNLRGQGGGE